MAITITTPIIVSVDISNYVEKVVRKFKRIKSEDNYEHDFSALKEGKLIEEVFGLNLDLFNDAQVYRNFVFTLTFLGRDSDYQMCDRAIEYVASVDPEFHDFVTAFIKGVYISDMIRMEKRRLGLRQLSDHTRDKLSNPGYSQHKDFLKHLPKVCEDLELRHDPDVIRDFAAQYVYDYRARYSNVELFPL